MIYGRQSLHGQALHRTMRVNLNNTVIFDEQAWPSRFALVLALAVLAGALSVAGCRSKKPTAGLRGRAPAACRSPAGPSAAAARRGACRAPAEVPDAGATRRGAARSSRRRADQPPAAGRVGRRRRAGDERPRLRDAARLPRWNLQAGPGRELGRLERRHATGGAGAQRRALARPPRVRRARRAGDGRAAVADGDRRAGAARRAGRRRVDRARDRADGPLRAQASL